MKKFVTLVMLLPGLVHASFSLESTQKVDSILREVEEKLPASIKDTINKKVTVGFKPLVYGDKKVWGQTVRFTSHIDLHLDLLKEENSKLAISTLIHEVTHLYDSKAKVSRDQVFLNIAGWQKKKITRRFDQRNKNQSRRVDVYEDSKPEETLAVNVEHFLQDPEYKCRKPSMYSYLSEKLNVRPFENESCDSEFRLAPSISFEGNVEKQKILDPSRLYEVHYFFAGEGKQTMSKWGHAMLRLVMCAPSRKVVDEKCLQDRAYHMIISFRADITNFNIDYIKGLTGKYTSKQFVLSMSEVIKEYTVGELRHLYSIPLRMNEEQKHTLVNLILENYWGYGSKYYFITNNCADETLNILRNVYSDDLRMVNLQVLTPLGIRKKFEELGISDMSIFNDLEAAKKSGHYFESLNSKLERIVNELKSRNIIDSKFATHMDVLTSTMSDRAEMAQKASSADDFGKLLFIEDVILNKGIISIQQSIGKVLYDQDKSGEGKLIKTYRDLEKLREKRSGLDLKTGYGIPQTSDAIFKTVEFSEEDEAKLKSTQKEFGAELSNLYSKEQKQLESMMKYKQQLLQNMKKAN